MFLESMKTKENDFVECLAYSEHTAVVMIGNFSDSYEEGKVSHGVIAPSPHLKLLKKSNLY